MESVGWTLQTCKRATPWRPPLSADAGIFTATRSTPESVLERLGERPPRFDTAGPRIVTSASAGSANVAPRGDGPVANVGVQMNRWILALAAMSSCGAVVALPFQNGSFEFGGVAPCNTFNVPAGSTLITGWTVSVGNIDWLGAPFPACGAWVASQGGASLDLVGSAAGGIGGIQQTFDTVAGQAYTVSFDLGGNFGAPPVIKPLAVTVNGVTTNFTFDTSASTGATMGWVTRSVQFTATGPSTTIDFVSDVSAAGGTLNAGAALDNVRVTALASASTAAIPLDWAHWAAVLLVMAAATMVFARRARTRR